MNVLQVSSNLILDYYKIIYIFNMVRSVLYVKKKNAQRAKDYVCEYVLYTASLKKVIGMRQKKFNWKANNTHDEINIQYIF